MNSLENSLPSGSVKPDVIDNLPMKNDPFSDNGIAFSDSDLPF